MTVASTTLAAAPATGTSGNATTKKLVSSDFETFLKMLTTQMQNQDPLNPIESADFAVQLATFSGVEQQVKTNDLLTSLGSQMGVMGMAQLAGWVGMDARANMPAWFDGTPVTLAPNPRAVADQAVLVVRDASGAEIGRTQIPMSSEPITWAGVDAQGLPIATGSYSFQLENWADGQLVATDPVEVYAPITEARSEAGAVVLILRGGIKVAADAVTALRAPLSAG